MNQIEAIALLKTLDIPLFFKLAPNGTKIPYMEVMITQPNNFSADNSVYVEQWSFLLRLYTRKKERALEQKVKKLLNDNEIYWTLDANYIDGQGTLESEFSFSTLGNDTPVPAPTPEPTPDPDPEPNEDEEGQDVEGDPD